MSSIRNIRVQSSVPDDLAKRIGSSGVNEILLTLWQGYYALRADSDICIFATTCEDDITQEWATKILRIWQKKNRTLALWTDKVVPVHQYADTTFWKGRGHKPTIDFCFRDWSTANSYFGVECKNLHGKRKTDIERYVDTGVLNYTMGRYGSRSSESALIGYVLSGKVLEIVAELVLEIAKTAPISNLSRELRFQDPQYISCHMRDLDNSEIKLHHLFFDFG